MNKLILEATDTTPRVVLDHLENKFEIIGEACPEEGGQEERDQESCSQKDDGEDRGKEWREAEAVGQKGEEGLRQARALAFDGRGSVLSLRCDP